MRSLTQGQIQALLAAAACVPDSFPDLRAKVNDKHLRAAVEKLEDGLLRARERSKRRRFPQGNRVQ